MSFIDRDALGREIEDRICAAMKAKDTQYAGMLAAMRMIIGTFPSAPVGPASHGTWLNANNRPRSWQFRCSACGQVAYAPQPTRSPVWKKHCQYAYCPYCGAEMESSDG